MTSPTEPYRMTVILEPGLYDMLAAWERKTAADMHVRSIPLTKIMRAMIVATAEDADVSAAVQTELAAPKWTSS